MLLNFAGSICTQASCDDDGTLHVECSNGYRFTVAAYEDFTAWELYGKRDTSQPGRAVEHRREPTGLARHNRRAPAGRLSARTKPAGHLVHARCGDRPARSGSLSLASPRPLHDRVYRLETSSQARCLASCRSPPPGSASRSSR
jgi:hypothetical protein